MFVLLINDSNSSGHILSKPGPSISENGPSIFEKCRDPRKTANFEGKKLFLVSEKNFPVRKWVCHVLFAKKMEKFRQIWPQQPLKHFTAAYRGLPPCTQSQHPINRETGNSNVLVSLPTPLLDINREECSLSTSTPKEEYCTECDDTLPLLTEYSMWCCQGDKKLCRDQRWKS